MKFKMISWTLLSLSLQVLFLLLLLSNSTALVNKGFAKKVCRGTQRGLSHQEGKQSYRRMRDAYTNCTYVDGNLELVFITDPSIELSFLSDIREVTGYVLIFATYLDQIPLHNLRVIRGRTLFKEDDHYYSLYVSNNFDVDRPLEVGLTQLGFTSLHEIQSGSVYLNQNNRLCHSEEVMWRDIVTGEGSQVLIQPFHPDHPHRECEKCDSSCEQEGGTYCWGDGPSMCQKLNKMICSRQCDGQCFGSLPSQCCDGECIGGCNGPKKTQCWACKNFNDNGSCERFCPAEFIYDHALYRQVPNPAFKFSYGTLCVHKCPEHMNSKQGACVHDCGAGMLPNEDRKCVPCDGPCPKTCKLDEGINAKNLAELVGCTVISGNLKLFQHSFIGDKYNSIPPLNVSQLNILKSVKEVTGYVKVQITHNTFKNLSFLSNLRVIHSQHPDINWAALSLSTTSLQSLGLDSLKSIVNGGVFIEDNKNLCYAANISWSSLFFNKTKSKTYIVHNKDYNDCLRDGEVCSEECTGTGCWGPLPNQCLSCRNFIYSGTSGFIRCVSSCSSEPGMYLAGPKKCQSCHLQCLSNCSGPEANECDKCKVAKDGPFCVDKCPAMKYLDHGGQCQECHQNCDDQGCTGPLPDQTTSGCVACKLPLVDDGVSNEAKCLNETVQCPGGYFRRHTKVACVKCHRLCASCDGPNSEDCLSCMYFRKAALCLGSCPDNHYIRSYASPSGAGSEQHEGVIVIEKLCLPCHHTCMGCHGDSILNCTVCKQYKVYLDESPGKFYCTEKCPDDKPDPLVNNTETVCIPIDYKERQRVILGTSSGVLIGISAIAAIIITLCFKRRKAKANLMKAKRDMKELSSAKEMIHLVPSQMEPDLSNLILVNISELDIGSTIGSGAYGTVCRGRWNPADKPSREVAIKILKEGSEGLLSEARIMVSVNDVNCISILCVCLTARLMLITPLMKLGCMLDYIRKNAQSATDKVLLLWTRQIAEGMHHLESKGIVHCDLAARNVLVESLQQVKITDFGLAKLVTGNDDLSASDAMTSTLKLPVKWLAYESLTERIFDHMSDVWGYGVTIWELCTFGDRPYRNITNFKLIPDFLEKGNRLEKPAICTDNFYRILLQCWDIDALKRPSFEHLVAIASNMLREPRLYIKANFSNGCVNPRNIPVIRGATHKSNNLPQPPQPDLNYLPINSSDLLNTTPTHQNVEYMNQAPSYMNQSLGAVKDKPYIPCDIPLPQYIPDISTNKSNNNTSTSNNSMSNYYNDFSPGFLNRPLNYQHYKSPTNNDNIYNNNNNNDNKYNNDNDVPNDFQVFFPNGNHGYQTHIPNGSPPTINPQSPNINPQSHNINPKSPNINNQPPTINPQSPSINNQPPTINNQPPTINNKPPTTTTDHRDSMYSNESVNSEDHDYYNTLAFS